MPLLFLVLLAAPVAAQNIDRFFEDFAAQWMRTDPESATEDQYFTGPEQDRLDRELTPDSDAWRRERIALARTGLAQLRKFNRASLAPDQRVSASMLEWQLDSVVRDEPYLDYSFPFDQMNGLQSSLPSYLTQMHPSRNRRDAENYLARLSKVAAKVDTAIADSRARQQRGKILPKFILNASIGQMERFIAPPPSRNLLVTTYTEKLPPELRKEIAALAEAEVERSIYPAWRRAIDLLRSQLPKASNDAGLWRFEDGAQAYAAALRKFTTTTMTAAEVHDLGLREVARIEGEMDGLLHRLGYEQGSVKDRYAKLVKDTALRGDDARAKVLADYAAIIRDAEKRSEALFSVKPKAPVEVRRIPEFRERNSPAHYTVPAPDGTRPGIFWAQLPGPEFETVGMRTLAYHEAIPGHHFQIAYQAENKNLPRFRRDAVFGFISAFGEGWALYAEHLAIENGWYKDDIKGHLGALDGELFRARRLVVDTGIHTKKWTREQAIAYGLEPHEVERYIVWPGQACSYKVGQLKILALRDQARKRMGARFSQRSFNDLLIRTGTVPLEVLEQVVEESMK